MTALTLPHRPAASPDFSYRLNDRYSRDAGKVFLTGTQALVRLPLMQAALDRRDGLNTAGFISGYRGSPLGGYDKALWSAKALLDGSNIRFQPAINEDLAATAVLGTQQVEVEGNATVDGVFSIWYGKGPGVDRSGDALKHGNAYGSSPHGGVLVVCGDDHGVVSSSMPHQSDQALIAWSMPILNPANIEEYLLFGLYGWALSRFSGAWIGFKAISETVESAASITLPDSLPRFGIPADFDLPPGGLHYRWSDLPSLAIESRLQHKLDAVRAFARTNPIDRVAVAAADKRLGIVTAGKAHLDLMEAARLLDLKPETLAAHGIAIRKLGLTYPIEPTGMQDFCAGLSDLLVVEEKGPVVEQQIKDLFYNTAPASRPRLWGKQAPDGALFLPSCGELRPVRIARALAVWLDANAPELNAGARLARAGLAPKPEAAAPAPGGAKRLPYFCSGCPHNSSTKVPDGSTAFAGIGCHFMASWMNRQTKGLTQMGGEGVNWVGLAPFTKTKHVFQNLGEGTYFHSGYMAIRQAVAAKANITFKILFNDAVAMTGGQPVDGQLTVPRITRQLAAEGVGKTIVVTDQPSLYRGVALDNGATVHDRAELDILQRELRETEGVTALIYDQTCAAEKRRRRKKNDYPDPPKRAFINDLVCEGCGDCGGKSNCLSIAPLETEFGRKRQIDQSSCNKDFSCVGGFCPSFVTVEGGVLKKPAGADVSAEDFREHVAALAQPTMRTGGKPAEILVAGVGGTGVVTVGALITMAAHLEGRAASVLDFTGFAQKGGTVLSYVRIGAPGENLNQVRIEPGQADTLLACDLVVGTGQDALATLDPKASAVIANSQEIHTAAFVQDPDAVPNSAFLTKTLHDAVGKSRVDTLNATDAARALMGDSIGSNILMLGYAWQRGRVPVGLEAMVRAIELNGVAVEANKRLFDWGRLLADDRAYVMAACAPKNQPERFGRAETLDDLVARRAAFLTDYQNEDYADRYATSVALLREREEQAGFSDLTLSKAAVRGLFKLMAYKDEYEVARLYTDGDFYKRLAETFDGDYRVTLHLAPPVLSKTKPGKTEPEKRPFGPWMLSAMRVLARFKGLRGTAFDPFGYTAERKTERRLIARYEALIEEVAGALSPETYQVALDLLSLPEEIRGFGPVKERHLAQVVPRWDTLLEAFRNPSPTAEPDGFRYAAE